MVLSWNCFIGDKLSFVSELLWTEEDAFVMYNFGPPRLRRDIGILGFLHKRVLEQCHPGVIHLLPLTAPAWHNKQIESNLDKCILRHGMCPCGAISIFTIDCRKPSLTSTQFQNFNQLLRIWLAVDVIEEMVFGEIRFILNQRSGKHASR